WWRGFSPEMLVRLIQRDIKKTFFSSRRFRPRRSGAGLAAAESSIFIFIFIIFFLSIIITIILIIGFFGFSPVAMAYAGFPKNPMGFVGFPLVFPRNKVRPQANRLGALFRVTGGRTRILVGLTSPSWLLQRYNRKSSHFLTNS
ncbi:MAG: hypothetical protein LUC47_09845, partial [Clostridiales bacterium]|nr:hypothetical protein [Clostridiales bacterium]